MKKKQQTQKHNAILIVLILVAAAAILLVMLRTFLGAGPAENPEQTTASGGEIDNSSGAVDDFVLETEARKDFNLENDLVIEDYGRYSGMYMEDGTNEVVSDVMMVVIRNDGELDVQLSNITMVCGGEEYHFMLTNLPAGARAVLLDQDRKTYSDEEITSAEVDNTVHFSQPMDCAEDRIQISGLDGMLNVQNVSETDITGDLWIYYKYTSGEIYYGGITFRVCIQGGLKAGEMRQITAGHFDPDNCRIIQVTSYE